MSQRRSGGTIVAELSGVGAAQVYPDPAALLRDFGASLLNRR
jgi:hypothetical protein